MRAALTYPVHEAVTEACKYAATLSRYKFRGLDRRFVPAPADLTATVTFVQVNGRTYAVTAHHVIESFGKQARAEGIDHESYYCPQTPGVAIQGPFLRPANYLITPPDIAICPIHPGLPDRIGKQAFCVCEEDNAPWPLSLAVAIGFPTEAKHELQDRLHDTRVAMPCVNVFIEGRSDGKGEVARFHSRLEDAPAVQNMSGLSGGLVLWSDESRYGLVGFVIEGDLSVPEGDADSATSEASVDLFVQRVDYGMLSGWARDVDERWTEARERIGVAMEKAGGRLPRKDRGALGLVKAHSAAMAQVASVARNSMVQLLRPQLKELDEAADHEFLDRQRTEMLKLLREPNMALDGRKSEELLRLVGMSHFYVLCRNKGIELDEVGGGATPGFLFAEEQGAIQLAVVTPSYAGGAEAIEAMVDESFEGNVAMQRRIDEGRTTVVSEQVIAPYGSCPHDRLMTHQIERLQEMIRAAAGGHVPAGNRTLLVCSLSPLHSGARPDSSLRPVYCRHVADEGVYPVTGELWMTAFSRPGMLIHSEPEFPGSPGLEGLIETDGLLMQREYSNVAGVLFVLNDINGGSRVLGLVRNEDVIGETVARLMDAWNDVDDSNGWCLEVEDPAS